MLFDYPKPSLNDEVEAWLAQGNHIKQLAHHETGEPNDFIMINRNYSIVYPKKGKKRETTARTA